MDKKAFADLIASLIIMAVFILVVKATLNGGIYSVGCAFVGCLMIVIGAYTMFRK